METNQPRRTVKDELKHRAYHDHEGAICAYQDYCNQSNRNFENAMTFIEELDDEDGKQVLRDYFDYDYEKDEPAN